MPNIAPPNSGISKKFSVSLSDPRIQAHFPGAPVIAAYMQLEWIEQFCKESALRLIGVENVKFKRAIVPPCDVHLSLNLSRRNFKISEGAKLSTSGRLLLE